MVTKSAASTTVDPNADPKHFDFEAFASGFKAAEFDIKLYRRADLIARISDLKEQIEFAKGQEHSVAEGDPSVLLIEEHNDLVEEFEASAVPFRFRPMIDTDRRAVVDKLRADGYDGLIDGALDEVLEKLDMEVWAATAMAQTCISHPLTWQNWLDFRHSIGEGAFAGFFVEWNTKVVMTAPRAPFSRLASPTRDGQTPSSSSARRGKTTSR